MHSDPPVFTPNLSSNPYAMVNSSPILFALGLLLIITFPVYISVVLYQSPDFSPVRLPADHSFGPSISIPSHHDRALEVTDRIGDGFLLGPEDLAFQEKTGFLYTGCHDGWIRRVRVDGEAEAAVEDWAYVGGRPLGVAFGPDGNLLVAEADKGLMMVKPDKTVDLLVDEAEGKKFLITDGVDVAYDSVVYFTDASYKYNLEKHMLDFLEGRPHGRLMSFDPSTNQTVVLLRDLYFANGLTLSPDQHSLIFCETPLGYSREKSVGAENESKENPSRREKRQPAIVLAIAAEKRRKEPSSRSDSSHPGEKPSCLRLEIRRQRESQAVQQLRRSTSAEKDP